jgi:glutaredoxin
MITLYSKDNCGFCTMAEALLKNNNYEYTKLKLDSDFSRELIAEQYPTARTFPVVVIGGEYIGGFQELKTYHDSQKGE